VLPTPALPSEEIVPPEDTLPPSEDTGTSEPGAGSAIGPPEQGSDRFAPSAIWMAKGVVLSSSAPGAMSGQDAEPPTTVTFGSLMASVPVTLLSALSVEFRKEKKT
jgi:hypothetical protein